MSTLKLPTKKTYRRWFKMALMPPRSAPLSWYVERGRQFERALHWLLEEEGLSPHVAYRIKGEQIDGAFECEKGYFLLEAKWHRKPPPIRDIDAFQSKVGRKLQNTLGVFISMSGYTKTAADTFVRGTRFSVVLFGRADMLAAFDPKIGFKSVLYKKLRAASEDGLAYVEHRPFVVSSK